MSLNDPQTAYALNQQAVEISRRLGPDRKNILIDRLIDQVRLTLDLNDYRQALAPFAEAEALLQQLGPENHPKLRGRMAFFGAKLANQQGKYQEAIAYARESIQIVEKLGFFIQTTQLIILGDAYTGLGEYDQARIYYMQALQQADEFGDLQKGYILFLLALVDFKNLSNYLIVLNMGLLANLNAMSMLPKARHFKLNKAQLDVAEDLEDDVAQLYEMTTIYREVMENLLNAYESALANNLQRVMKTLTTISLILFIPIMITALFSMNLMLPFDEKDPIAFPLVIVISALFVLLMWWVFRMKQIL